MDTVVTVTGNLARDPEVSFTATGAAWCRFTIAATPRFRDKDSGEYRDGDTLWMRCVAWRQLAENIAESLTKGSRVVATGRLRPNEWTTDTGEKRTSMELHVDEIGPSLKWATATVNKMSRSSQTGDSSAPPKDPFAVREPVGVGAGQPEEPPF
jgi:single-strand DNA-binding protein